MQIVFLSMHSPQSYTESDGTGEYPDAPKRCPFPGCHTPTAMAKHGYYSRYLVVEGFCGRIRVRRYICPKCGRTVSMLPSFCLSRHTYGVAPVVKLMRRTVEAGSARGAASACSVGGIHFTRRHAALYLTRLRSNYKLVQYGVMQMCPGSAIADGSPGAIEATGRLLLWIRPTLTAEFNADFHRTTGMSFMSSQTRIA